MSSCVSLLTCPVCGASLAPADPDAPHPLRCPARHTFDRARDGAIDLLPPGHGRSRRTGDDAVMVDARRRFLARGWYTPFLDALSTRAGRHTAASASHRRSDRMVVVDAGCGDGWWIGRLHRALADANPDAEFCSFGFDLSRNALRRAARAWPDVQFLRNDVQHRICLGDAAADVLLNVFAPRNAREFARVLRVDGLALVAIPHEHHLAELRKDLPLLAIDADKRDRTIAAFAESLQLDAEEEIVFTRTLAPEDAADLLRMSPNRWHLEAETLAAIATGSARTVTFGMRLLAFRHRVQTVHGGEGSA